MRKIWPEKDEIGSSLFPNGSDFVTKEELTKLVVRFDDLSKDFTSLKEYLDTFIQQLGETLTTKNINAINASLDNILAGIINAKELSVDGKITADELEVVTTITTDFIKSVRAVFNELDVETINAKDVEFVNTITNKLTAETVDIKNWSIENLKIETAEIDNLETKTIGAELINTDDIQTDTIEAESGNINEITSDKITTGKLDTFEVKTSQYIWKEIQEVVDADRFYLELPHFENGTYYIKAITGSFDEDSFEGAETLFTIESRNSVDNYFISWSQDELGYLERVYITTKENKLVYRIFNLRGKKIRLLFANVSSTNVGAPNSFEDYDQQISASYVFEYKDGNKFFRPVDLFNDGVAVGVLSLDSTDVYTLANDDEVVYDTTENKRYTSYLPDQSVNTKDNVKFNSVDAPFLDITNATIKKRIRTPNIYNGPETDLDTLNNDTLYIPNKTETEYTGWAFKIENISEYTDNWQDACRGYDWSKTTYVGEELGFDQTQDVSEIVTADVQHICVRGNTFYLMYGSTSTNTGNIATLNIDENGVIEYRKQAAGADKRFWVERAATNQIQVANLVDYDEVWFGDMLDTDNYKIVYKNVKLFKGHEIPFKKVVDTDGILYRKTNNGTEDVIAEIVPINTETKVQYEEGTPLTYDVETREITADDDINIKNDLTVANKTTTKELEVEEDATIDGDLYVEGELTTTGDAKIAGDLYVTGTTHVTSQEDLVAFGDIVTIRANNELPLADGQVSGVVVNNYNGTNDLALVTDNEGTLRVGTGDGESTTYDNILYDDSTKKWYKYTITDDEIELGDEVTINGSISSWENRRVENNYTVYDSVTTTVIDKTSLVPLLGRAEAKNLTDGALFKWNADKLIAETIPMPDEGDLTLTTTKDTEGNIKYAWINTSTSDFQKSFDDNRPVGSTYTQYPWQKDPNTLFNSDRIESVWEAIKDYDGAFFRAEGGLAEDFQEEPNEKRYRVVQTPLVRLFLTATTIPNAVNSESYIVSITTKDDIYHIQFADGSETDAVSTRVIYNFDIPIGSIDQVLKRQDNWHVRVQNDKMINTTKTNVVLSTTSNANPTAAQHQVSLTPIVNGQHTIAVSESGVSTILTNRSSLVYDKNINLGHVEGLYTKWNVKTGEGDNYIASPLYEDGTVFTIANTATPTEAQTITSVEQVGTSQTYNVRFADGHTANYASTTAYYAVYDGNTSRVVCTCGQIAAIFQKWQHDIEVPIENNFLWEFPDTDEYCFTTTNTTNPTDAQIIKFVFGDWFHNNQGNNHQMIEVEYKNGTIGWFIYNAVSIYFVDKVQNTATYVGLSNMFMAHNNVLWTKNTRQTPFYIPNENVQLSIVSAASPTDAQTVKYVVSTSPNHYIVVRKDNTVSVYNTTGVSTILYDKNTVWGSINATKLSFTEIEENVWRSSIVLKDNEDHFITRFCKDEDRYWYEYSEEGETKEVDITNSLSVYDDEGENYAITYKTFVYSCSLSVENVDYYDAPPEGTIFGNPDTAGMQMLYTTTSTTSGYSRAFSTLSGYDDNLANTLYEANPSAYANLIDKAFLLPGSTMPVRIQKNGNLSTVASPTALIGYARNINGPSMAGIIWTEALVKKIPGPRCSAPPEGCRAYCTYEGNKYFLYSTFCLSKTNIRLFEEATGKWLVIGNNNNLVVQKDGANVVGTPSGLYTMLPIDYGNEDIEYYYPPEVDWKGEEYIASIASNANPTDAQKIVKIDPIEGTTTYNVHFADGHQTSYTNTQPIYNANKYYTTLQGIAEAYIDFNFESIPVQYNIAVNAPTIGGTTVRVTRYTGVAAGNNSIVTYSSESLLDPVLRNNTTVMSDGNPLGYSISWNYRTDNYSNAQDSGIPATGFDFSIAAPGWAVHSTIGYGNGKGEPSNMYYVGTSEVVYAGNTINVWNHRQVSDPVVVSKVYQYGLQEARPKNYTIRIWVRVE